MPKLRNMFTKDVLRMDEAQREWDGHRNRKKNQKHKLSTVQMLSTRKTCIATRKI